MLYTLYNADQPVATFTYENGVITGYTPQQEHLLPKQICHASHEGFVGWLRERTIDLNTFLHRQLANELIGSRDKTAVAILTHMFSVSDTFTCFPEGEFTPRSELCQLDEHSKVSDFILISSDTSLRKQTIITPNASTDGSFPKTWKHEAGVWWLYKIQSPEATQSEYAISQALIACGWSAAEYQLAGDDLTRIRSRNFVGKNEFFEPYDSLRFMFENKSDDDKVIYRNIASLGETFEKAFRRILLADALFMNADRHMRNFGVIRSAVTGEILRMAPNFDNNQAFLANPGGHYSDQMLKAFANVYGITEEDRSDLRTLLNACAQQPYLQKAFETGEPFLHSM